MNTDTVARPHDESPDPDATVAPVDQELANIAAGWTCDQIASTARRFGIELTARAGNRVAMLAEFSRLLRKGRPADRDADTTGGG